MHLRMAGGRSFPRGVAFSCSPVMVGRVPYQPDTGRPQVTGKEAVLTPEDTVFLQRIDSLLVSPLRISSEGFTYV